MSDIDVSTIADRPRETRDIPWDSYVEGSPLASCNHLNLTSASVRLPVATLAVVRCVGCGTTWRGASDVYDEYEATGDALRALLESKAPQHG